MKPFLALSLAALAACVLPALAAPVKPNHHKRMAGHKTMTGHRRRPAGAYVDINTAIMCSHQGDAKLVLIALRHGDSINQRGADGGTPLINAASQNWTQLTRLLIQMGANVAAEDPSGMNALDYASKPEEIAILLNAGAKGSKRDLDATADSLETDEVTSLKYVDGYVNNNSKATYDYVEVDVVFFDSAGDQIDSGVDNTQHLAAGGVWKFKVNSLRDGVTSYKIVKVSGA